MRFAILVLAACGTAAHVVPPTDVAVPLGYMLRLELDPDRDELSGHVEVRVRLEAPSNRVWLDADELAITHATFRAAGVRGTAVATSGGRRVALALGRTVAAGELVLSLDYTGHTGRYDQQGLFRQRAAGHWYLFSQAESVFARRIVPCFDEPRFKVPWQVTLVVPAGSVALANTAELEARTLADGRRERVFAPTPPMAPHLLAVAVGPFELVEVGRVGRARVPVRVAALAGQRDQVGVVAAMLPGLVETAEKLVGEPLPLDKLDLVVVPRLFGAMENPGLVTFAASELVGDAHQHAFAAHFARIAAHELAHQWFGNIVTPERWDDLWLAESIASWLGDRVAAARGLDDGELRLALARGHALAHDGAPLHRTVVDPEAAFDAIAYDKGEAVLATVDAWSPGALVPALRRFLHAHAGGTATTDDLVAAVAATPALGAPLARVLAGYARHAGAPVVDLRIDCAGPPAIVAHARDGLTVPVCARWDGGERCALVADHARISLGSRCPGWLVGNARGGYYHAAGALVVPPAHVRLAPRELIALGQAVAAAATRGELSGDDAVAAADRLAERHGDPYALLGVTAIASAIDPWIGEDARAAWGIRVASWLGAANATPATLAGDELQGAIADLVPSAALPPATSRAALAELEVELRSGQPPDPVLAGVAAAAGGRELADQLAQLAEDTHDGDTRDAAIEALGRLGPGQAARAVDFVLTSRLPAADVWPAVTGYFARGATRHAAWYAVLARLPALQVRLASQPGLLGGAAATLCSPDAQREVAVALRAVEAARVLAGIEACVARRARAPHL